MPKRVVRLAIKRRLLSFLLPMLLTASQSAVAGVHIPVGAKFSLGDGSLELGCGDMTIDGVVNANQGSLSLRHLTIGSLGRLVGGSSLIEVLGNWTKVGTFIADSGTIVLTDGCGVSTAVIAGENAFFNLNITSSQGKVFQFSSGVTQTVANRLLIQGVHGNPLVLKSSGEIKAIFDVQGEQDVSYADTSMVDLPDTDPVEVINTGLPVWLLWYVNEHKGS